MEKITSNQKTAWCPGCGNFSILEALTEVLNELEFDRKEVVLVGGIGQAAKLNQYVNTNGFSGLHGRALPAACGIKLANSHLKVIVNSGDGDSYGEGGNHFIHTIQRNVDITHFVHNNQIYGLTKGQASPTSEYNDNLLTNKYHVSTSFNPLAIAIASGATFVARGFSGHKDHLKEVMKAAILHKGYAIVDILQPCVSFNKVNTFEFYRKNTYILDESYDSHNQELAFKKSMEKGKLALGILYEKEAFPYQGYYLTPLIEQKYDRKSVEKLIKKIQEG